MSELFDEPAHAFMHLGGFKGHIEQQEYEEVGVGGGADGKML